MKVISVPFDSDNKLNKLKRFQGIISATVSLVNIKYPEGYTGYRPIAYKEILIFFDEDQICEANILSMAGRGLNANRYKKTMGSNPTLTQSTIGKQSILGQNLGQ